MDDTKRFNKTITNNQLLKYSTDESSDEDSNYVSYHDDNESANMDSDDEYTPVTKKNYSKRLLGGAQQKVFRNLSTASSLDESHLKHIERMPTRRPNPKIFNRNALMARENRKKKKEHLEGLEKNVESLKMENKSLKKLLKKRSTMVTKLRDEGLYLKSIIANKTSIMALLKTIDGNKIPMTSSNLSFVTNKHLRNESSASTKNYTHQSNSGSCYSPTSTIQSFGDEDEHEEKENGTVTGYNDPFLSSTIIDNYFSFTDLDFNTAPSSTVPDLPMGNWESLLNDDTPFQTTSSLNPRHSSIGGSAVEDDEFCSSVDSDDHHHQTDLISNVSKEHNYFNNNFNEQQKQFDEPGICLHLSSGRISLEFCASCHRSSQNAWYEEM